MLTHEELITHPLGIEYRKLCWVMMLETAPHPDPGFDNARQRAAYEREALKNHGRCPDNIGWKNPSNNRRLFNYRSTV